MSCIFLFVIELNTILVIMILPWSYLFLLMKELNIRRGISYTPFKKVTQHDFDRLYFFYPGFVFIKLDIPGKPVYLPFD